MSDHPYPTRTPPADSETPDPGLSALLTHAAVAPLGQTAWLRVTGEDRVRWLNGMVTNSIQSLLPGQGCYNFLLSAQGRIQGDATAFALPDALLLETGRERLLALTTWLERFIIMDDVELTPQPAQVGVLLAGPRAAATLEALGVSVPSLEPMHLRLTRAPSGDALTLVYAYSPLIPRFELWASAETISNLTAELLDAGAVHASESAIEHLRILEATPLYGVDIRERELPQETAQTRALHFTKGCYLGQEIVERIHSRGNVHRTFAAFTLLGELPAAGAVLVAGDAPEKPIGELTSVARISLPSGTVQRALGYVRREALDRSANLTYPGGSANLAAPFHLADVS